MEMNFCGEAEKRVLMIKKTQKGKKKVKQKSSAKVIKKSKRKQN